MYQYYRDKNKIICVSSYAGKSVRGIAKRDPMDKFDPAYGCLLANSRCRVKISKQRVKNAAQFLKLAEEKLANAEQDLYKAQDYLSGAELKLQDALSEEEMYSHGLLQFNRSEH